MSRPIPASLGPVLSYLLPLLGSRKDAEALGAAREIDRKLRAAGCDLRDLADLVSPPPPPEPPRPPSPPKPPAEKSAKALAWRPPVYPVLDDAQRAELRAQLAEAFEDCSGRLQPWEKEHIATMLERLSDGAKPPTDRMLERATIAIAKVRRPS